MRHAVDLVLAVALVAVAGCSGDVTGGQHAAGSSAVGGASGSSGQGAGSQGAGGFAPHPTCAAADGTRLCGGSEDCAALQPPECAGYGCTPALDRDDLAPSAAGVCWADLDQAAAEPCFGCEDGDACVQRTADQLVCAPVSVCEALWDLGATTVCRYADKSPYDHQYLPIPSGPCPSPGLSCGGDCGSCSSGMRCTGRSPTHPFGVCVGRQSQEPNAPVFGCSIDAGGSVTAPGCGVVHDAVCGVFGSTAADQGVARRYGVCLEQASCATLATQLPGGFRCFDFEGNELKP